MEAAQETLTYPADTLLHRKLLPENTRKDKAHSEDHATETTNDESNYVDLDMKPNNGATTVKVTFAGEGNQLPVIKCNTSKQGECGEESVISTGDCLEEQLEDTRGTFPAPVLGEPPLETLTKLPGSDRDSDSEERRRAELDCGEHVCSENDELQYTDMYLNSKAESDDGASAVMSDHCGSDTVEDESHYITTHEIQLTELDHDVDYDVGRGTGWDFEDDNLVFSFVDYASFESNETQGRTLILRGRGQAKVQANPRGEVVTTELEDSDLCDSDKCASSDESLCKNHRGDTNAGKIHVSIKTSSRAVNNTISTSDNSANGYTKHFGDGSHFSFVSSGSRMGPLGDRAQYFIPAPGRQHLASKLRRKDINEYSSGASSSISELDDADKEVRNLTAKSFRSLACPYFDAINLSTSSESSMSEYGMNNWSAYVDLKYGNISQGREGSVIETSSSTLEMNRTVDGKRNGRSITGMNVPQTKMYALNKSTTSEQSSSSTKKIQLNDPDQPKQRGVTLNFRCNVEAPEGARLPNCSKKARSNELTGTVLARSGCEMRYINSDCTGGTHKRAVFASSLLKNVISKKMQFEQERKMERGEKCDAYPALSSSFQCKDHDGVKDRGQGIGLQRQTSESGSCFTVNSADDQYLEGSRTSSCEPAEEHQIYKAPDDLGKGKHKPPMSSLGHSQNSAFDSLKEEEPKSTPLTGTQTKQKGLDTSSMLTKLLFVPTCQLLSKEKDCREDVPIHAPATGAPAGTQKCEKELKTGNNGIIDKEENEKGGKPPGIKICLRSVKENKGCTLNIANLLTPKISLNTGNTFKVADDARCHAADKIPNFTVRDIRDTKCKFQTPIYQVRDVRKLVKSSYRFVSLDNSEGKCSTAAEKLEVTKAPTKHVLPSPIVIKCHSVKTNVKQQAAEAVASSESAQSENTPPHGAASRVPLVASKQQHPDQSDVQPNIEAKLTKQRQERFACETSERRNEPKIPKQAALEKLKAAVKTMEQLYVFDRNEWKRKSQAPQPITDSHVLSLIAREEQGAEELEATNTDRFPQPQDAKALSIIRVPYDDDTFQTQSQQSKTFSNKRVLHFGNRECVSMGSVSDPFGQNPSLQTSATMKSFRTPAAPLSVKIAPPNEGQVEQGKVKMIPANPTVAQACSDSGNYLTIPGYTNEVKLLHQDLVTREVSSNVSEIQTGVRRTPERETSPLVPEYPASSIYHQTQQQVVCFSPSVPNVSPTPSAQTQRKMLLDPTTGHYYLVDTPIQPTTKRLFDPETGHYVDVPMSGSPVAPVTPVPLSLSPLALSPAAYAPAYVIYPGFIPSPTLPAQAVLCHSPCHSEGAGAEKVKKAKSPKLDTSATGAESAYYSATGEATQGPLQLPVSLGHVAARGGAASSDRKPLISITTQQGPRIIAPPSFDGTTMSFVVEHR
ncbi:uncharacterized protein C4orf54 homolog [Pungitius pungitius]|uniref:uncharacterized protein C4orf54 homolog n=1 Tax=Pungitius pungitius TaxID=134920 RepID=UPI002E0E78D5